MPQIVKPSCLTDAFVQSNLMYFIYIVGAFKGEANLRASQRSSSQGSNLQSMDLNRRNTLLFVRNPFVHRCNLPLLYDFVYMH